MAGLSNLARRQASRQRKSAAFAQLHADPAFANARDQRARARFTADHAELQRKSNAARRGVDVPPEIEEVWKALKRKRLSNEEAAACLRLPYKLVRPHRRRP